MSHDLRFLLLSVLPTLGGLMILHYVTRQTQGKKSGGKSGRGVTFVFVGLLLFALPLIVWGALFLGSHAGARHAVGPAEVLFFAGYLDVAFLWLIWSINACAFRPADVRETVWDDHWGESYSPELKRRLLGAALECWDREGRIGDLVVDVGSGAMPVSKLLPTISKRKFILIDIAAREHETEDSIYLRRNAENIARPELLSYRKALLRIGKFLGLEGRTNSPVEQVTTLVFSDILNYVDYRKVMAGFTAFLRPGGRVIVVNLPGRGVREEFSENGLKRNEQLYQCLEEQGFEIESKEFPCRAASATEESEEMIVLMARKKVTVAAESVFVAKRG